MAASRAFAFLQSEDPKRKFQAIRKGRHLRVLTSAKTSANYSWPGVRAAVPGADLVLDAVRGAVPVDHHPPPRHPQHLLHPPALSLLQGV